MKQILNLFLILTLMGFATNTFAQAVNSRMSFEKTTHDFGSFSEQDGIQTATFNFKNTGSNPLIINNIQASCGCTTPEWTRQPIPPGQDGFVKVAYNPANRPGAFNRTVQVLNNSDTPSITLRITGTVSPRERTVEEIYPREIGPLRATNNHISFVKLTEKEVKSETLEVINTSANDVKLEFRATPAHITVKAEPSVVKPGAKANIVVTYDASKVNTFGFVTHRIYLNIDGRADYKNSIGVSATIEEDFSGLSADDLRNAPVAEFDKTSADLGDIKQGETKGTTFLLKNTGKKDLVIRRVNASCGCTAVTPEKQVIASNESVPLKVEFNSAGRSGRQTKSITVITNDPKNPTSILRISGNIVTP